MDNRHTFSANLAASLAFGKVVLICSCLRSEVTRFLISYGEFMFEYSSFTAHLSISILCEDVLENFRKATPCFMVARQRYNHAQSGGLREGASCKRASECVGQTRLGMGTTQTQSTLCNILEQPFHSYAGRSHRQGTRRPGMHLTVSGPG